MKLEDFLEKNNENYFSHRVSPVICKNGIVFII
jgi:hypothetical protein